MNKRDFLKDAILFFRCGDAAGAGPAGQGRRRTGVDPAGYDATKHWYGMGIDVDKCIGCNRCVEACKAENDVPEEPFFFRTWIERYQIHANGETTVECISHARVTAGAGGARGSDSPCARSSCRSSATSARTRPACRSARWARLSRRRTAWCW